MATLVAIGYPDQGTAEQARETVRQLEGELIIQAEQVASISRDPEGKYHVHTSHGGASAGAGAWWGGFWGFLFGLLFFIPFAGLAIGAGMGALFGKLGKTGLDQQVLQQMGDAVPPGKAGWFLLISQKTDDKFEAAVTGSGAKLVRSNLTEEQEKQLKHAFGARKHQA